MDSVLSVDSDFIPLSGRWRTKSTTRWIPYFATRELLRLDRRQTWAASGLTGSFFRAGPIEPISVEDRIFSALCS